MLASHLTYLPGLGACDHCTECLKHVRFHCPEGLKIQPKLQHALSNNLTGSYHICDIGWPCTLEKESDETAVSRQ